MIRRILVAALFAAGAISSPAQPSLPSSFHAFTVHSPENAEIFVRYGETGPVVVCCMDTRRTAIPGARSRRI